MSETGVVKFECEHSSQPLANFPALAELNECRREIRQLGLLGVDANGIGFGNISLRDGLTSDFFITGSGTSALVELKSSHVSKVTGFDFERNWIRCEGSTIASSESLTHAAIYQADREVCAVIHGHCHEVWSRLLCVLPTTAAEVEYGTPAMAKEVQRLFETTNVSRQNFFVMAGHAGGVVAFGYSLGDALNALTRSAQL